MIRNTKETLLTPEQIAERLKLSVYTVSKIIRTEQIESIRLTNRSIRGSEEALRNFIKQKTIKKKNHAKKTDSNKKKPPKGLPSFRALKAV